MFYSSAHSTITAAASAPPRDSWHLHNIRSERLYTQTQLQDLIIFVWINLQLKFTAVIYFINRAAGQIWGATDSYCENLYVSAVCACVFTTCEKLSTQFRSEIIENKGRKQRAAVWGYICTTGTNEKKIKKIKQQPVCRVCEMCSIIFNFLS